MYLPLFEATGFREGYLSGQVDPRKSFDKAAMLEQALELHAINPNVIVKVPGTAEGYWVIEEHHFPRHLHKQHPHIRLVAAHGLCEVREEGAL